VILVYAKKHTGLSSLDWDEAVEEALCFGWIDSKIHPIDDDFYMQMFTPRKPKSAWSALNKARVKRLLADGLMCAAGLAVVKAAKASGTWEAMKHAEELMNPEASGHWASYSGSRRREVLYRLAGAKRPETRAKYLQQIIENMSRNLSREERMAMAGFRPKARSTRAVKR